MRLFLVVSMSILICFGSFAAIRDLGKHGEVFEIAEKSLLEVIQERLSGMEKEGKLEELNNLFAEKVKKKVLNPTPVEGIVNTVNEREFFFDPSIFEADDITDHEGNIIVKGGTTLNPLDHVDWGRPLIFINGKDEKQVAWALKQEGKLVLTNGSPFELNEKHNFWFYFDQGGALTEKFGISQVPAIVSQEGKMLKISEIKI
jgi:conjugal transfer pilus assembly protein TraW